MTGKAVTEVNHGQGAHYSVSLSLVKCDPPQEFDAKGESTRTTRLHDTLSVP